MLLLAAGAAAGAGAAWLAWQWAIAPGGPLHARENAARYAPGESYTADGGGPGVSIGAYTGEDGRRKVFGGAPIARSTRVDGYAASPAGALGPHHALPGGVITVSGAAVDAGASIVFVAYHLLGGATDSERAGELRMGLVNLGSGRYSVPRTALVTRRYDNGGPSFVTVEPRGDFIIKANLYVGDVLAGPIHVGAGATDARVPRRVVGDQ